MENNINIENNNLYNDLEKLNSNLEQVFQSVSDGKTLVTSAITDMGIETDATSTFEIMSTNIKAITTGVNVSSLTLVHQAYGSNKAFSSSYTASTSGVYIGVAYSGGQGTNNSTYISTSGTSISAITTNASAGQNSISILFASLSSGQSISGGNPNAHTYNRAGLVVYKLG